MFNRVSIWYLYLWIGRIASLTISKLRILIVDNFWYDTDADSIIGAALV